MRDERAAYLNTFRRAAGGPVARTMTLRGGERFVMDHIEEGRQAAIDHTWGDMEPSERVRSRSISAIGGTHGRHVRDADCTMDDDGIFCIVCGVLHGWPCADCGGCGFHAQACLETEH